MAIRHGQLRSSAWAALLLACAQAQAPVPAVVAYTHAPDGGPPWPTQDVCTVRSDGTGAQCLTADGHSHHPSWFQGGKRILFIHDAKLTTPPLYRETAETRSHHPIELSVMDANGRNRRVLRVIEPVIYSAAGSPDGTTLAVSAATPMTPGQPATVGLFLLPADGRGELRLLVKNAWTPAWSPDGKRLAFTVEHPRGRWSVHTAHADGASDFRLTDADVDSGSPAWSPDGRRIAFDQFTGANGRQQIFLMQADGSGVRQLTTDPAWSCTQPSWSAGGKQIVASCRSVGSPCGMGSFSNGEPMLKCSRRLFVISLIPGVSAAKLIDHDGYAPSLR